MNIDYNALLDNSPSAIAFVKQKIKAQSFLQGKNVGLVLIYGGAPSDADIAQAIVIASKVHSILVMLGQQGFAFQRASYYDSLYILGSPPGTVEIDVYLFQ